MTDSSPYRDVAIQHRIVAKAETLLLPRFVSLRTAAYLWGLLVLLLIAVVVLWFEHIPAYSGGLGIVVGPESAPRQQGLYLFLPADQLNKIHKDLPVTIYVGGSDQEFITSVLSVEKQVVTPSEARQQFKLGSSAWGVATEPAIIVKLKPIPAVSLKKFAGSMLNGQVQVSSRPVLSLLPWVGLFIGGASE